MRIYFPSTVFPSAGAKRLKKAFAAAGGDVGPGICRELIARFTGYLNWYELEAVTGWGRADPLDWDVDDDTFAARGEQYIGKLTECGIDRNTAEFIIDLAGPTGEGASGEELRQAVAAWNGPPTWTLRREGDGYLAVAGDRNTELWRKLAQDRGGRRRSPESGGPVP